MFQRMRKWAPFRFVGWFVGLHALGSILIVVYVTQDLATQVRARDDFANAELGEGVESRWGAPIHQSAASLRYVESGSIFSELKSLAFAKQHVRVDADMNYRKRGLRYFSGFDFNFRADYAATNTETHDIDVAFVFPIEVRKAESLLSDLEFTVNGEPQALDLQEDSGRLLWTGRLQKGASITFAIAYQARGLDQFVYQLDPEMPARDIRLHIGVKGGDNFDYPAGVLSANALTEADDGFRLDWSFRSLESGIALGVILPSVEAYDEIIATAAERSIWPFLFFFLAMTALAMRFGRKFAFYDAYLVSSIYAFYFVLLAYLAAYTNFYLAYLLACVIAGGLFYFFGRRNIPGIDHWVLLGIWASTIVLPSLAVLLQGYTGLIYTLEALGLLVVAISMISKSAVRDFISEFVSFEKVEA